MGRFDAVLKDPEYLKLSDAQKKEVWDGLFQKHVAADKEYGMLDEAQRGEVYQGFIQKYYSPQQPTQDVFAAVGKPNLTKTVEPVESLQVPGVGKTLDFREQQRIDTERRTRDKINEARLLRDQILREIEAGSQQAGMPVDQVKDFVNINGIDVPKSEWNKLRLRIANADLQPNNYTDPIEFNTVKAMESEERVAQSQREIDRLKKQMAETTDPSLVPIIGENLRKQELLQETYLSGMTKIEREGYALGREKSDSGAAGRMFGSFGKGGMDVLTLGMIPLLAPDTKLAKYLSAYEKGITAPTGRPLEDAFTSLALSAPLSMGFFIGGLAPAGARAAINTAMSLGMLMNTQGRKYATAYARYGSATATPDAAIEGGALSAVLETAIETFSDVAQTDIVLGIMKRSGKKAAKNYVRKELSQRLAAAAGRYGTATLEAIGTEAGEELLQTAQDMVVDVATKQREVPTLPEAFQEIGYAAAVGALGGLTFGLLGGTVRPYVEFRTWRSVDKQAKSGNETAKRLMEARKLIEAGNVDEGYEVVKSDMEAIASDTFNETDENVTQAAGQMYDAYAMVGKVENPSAKLMDALIKAMDEGVDGEAAATIIEGTESIDDVISELRAATEEAKAAITTEEAPVEPVIAEPATSETPLAETVVSVVGKKKAWQMTQKEMLATAEKDYLKRNPKQITGSESKTVIDKKTGKKRTVVTKYIEGKTKITDETRKSFIELHKSSIISALKRGDKVSPEVLAEYPGLTAETVLTTVEKANTPAQPATETEIKPEVKAKVGETKKYYKVMRDSKERTGFKKREAINAKPISKEHIDAPGLELYISREYDTEEDPKNKGGWSVTDNITGSRVSSGRTKKEAIETAKSAIQDALKKHNAKNTKQLAKIMMQKAKEEAERNAKQYDDNRQIEKETYFIEEHRWLPLNVPAEERAAHHKKLVSKLEQAKAQGYKYYAYNRADMLQKWDIDEEIEDQRRKAKIASEPDAFKRNVMEWTENYSLKSIQSELSYVEKQLKTPDRNYKNKSKEAIQQEIDILKEAIRQSGGVPASEAEPEKNILRSRGWVFSQNLSTKTKAARINKFIAELEKAKAEGYTHWQEQKGIGNKIEPIDEVIAKQRETVKQYESKPAAPETDISSENDIFIRALTSAEKKGATARRKGEISIPDKEGYVVAYKPYGNSGDRADAGYYYVKQPAAPEAKADNIVSQTEDEYDIAAKEIYALENRAAALVYSNDGSGKAKPDNISADDWDRLWGLADGLIGKRYYDTLAPYEQQAKENREIDAWLTKIETNLALAPTEAEQVKSDTSPDADTRYKELSEAEQQIEAVRKQYEGTAQWMKAPNGKPTKLNERQWLQVRTPNFLNWFGDWINDPKNASKVVDENGEPMVVYHGTGIVFSSYSNAKFYSGWWSTDPRVSEEFGDNIYPAFAKIIKPLLTDDTKAVEVYREITGLSFHENVRGWNIADMLVYKYRDSLADMGYDGAISWDETNLMPAYAYIPFSPNQIKSATGNTGEFDASNPDIRYSPTVDYQTANMIYKTEPISIEGITRAITSVIPKQWISKITTEGESARIVFMNGREVLVNALTGAIADQNGKPIAVGRTTINRKVSEANNVIAIIDIAKNYNNGNITAYHEGFHLAFNLMLSEAEQATVLRHYSGKNASELTRAERIDAEEMAARDFEHIMKYGKPPVPAKVKGVLARLWESIRTFVRKLMGKNYYDANFQILERIRTGEADTFNYNARDYFTNASDEALYRKIKDPLEGVKVTERQMQKAVYQIEKISDRVIDITRNLSEFGIKVTAVYNKTKSEAKRQLLINEFANYLEQALPHLPGFTRTEIADMVRSVNKVKSIRSFMRRLAMVEKKINNRYARKLYPAMQTMLKVSTKSAYQKDLLSRKRMVADEVLEKLNYIKSVFEMSQDKIEAEMLRLATTNEQVNDDAAANPEAAEIVNNETEWKMRYLELFSGLKREGVSKSGKKRVIYGSAERMAIAYEEIRSLIKTGKSMMQEMEAKRKEEHTRLIRQTIIALIGNKVYGDGIKTPLEKFQEANSLNPIKAATRVAKKGSAKILFLETIIENMSFASLRNHEGIKEYRAAKEKEFNEAIANAEDESKIPLMEFNRDQYLAAIDEIINVTANYKGLFKNWFQDTYFRPMYQAYRDRNAGLTQYTKIIHNMRAEVAKEVYGNEGLTDYLPALMSSTVQNIKISLLDPKSGKRVNTRISMQALGTMYAYSLNPDYADNVKNTGFDDIAIKQMMDIFASSKAGKYMQRWVERVTYEFYPMYYDTINNVFKERNGYSLGRELIYTPAIMDVKDKLKMPEIGNPSFAAIESYGIHLASHIARVNNNAAFKLSALNFDAQLTNHIHNNEHYKSHVMPMYNARTTILSQPVLAAIDATLGEEQRRALTSYYRDIAANGYVKQDVSNLVNQWMSNMSMAYLSFSPKVALKQVSSFAYAAAYMSPAEFAQHTAWVMSHPHIVAKIMRKSPTFNIRYKEGITSEQYLYLHMGSASSSKRLIRQQIGKYGNWSRYGDQAAALIGGGAIYRKEYLRLQNENPSWTKAQLEEAATYQMELFVDRTQQSASILFTPQLRREGSFWRLATQFKTQKFAMFNATYNAISQLRYTKGNLDKALWMFVVLTMILPVMEWLGDNGFTEPGSVWDIYLGGVEQMVEMIPLYGEIASGLMLWAAKGESPDYGRIIPAVGGLPSLAIGLERIDRAYDNWREWGEVDIMLLMDGIAGASAPVTGMPIYPLIQNAKGITDFTSGEDERIMRLFGYSKGLLDYAEKTYGKEQE